MQDQKLVSFHAAKLQKKSEKIAPFGGIFHVRDQFSRSKNLGNVPPIFELSKMSENDLLEHQNGRILTENE